MHALSVSLLRAKQLPVITNGLGASPHAGSTCTIGVVAVRPLNRLPARLYFKLKPDPNNTFFFIFTCTTQYPWVLANLNLSQAIAPSKKKRTHTVFRDSSAHRSASTSKPRFVGERVKLGDVCTIVSGATPKTKTNEYWGGEIRWVTPAELDGDSHYISDTEKHLTEAGYKSASLRMMPKGTVLLTTRAPIGKVAIAAEEMSCNQGFKNLVCSSAINNEFLYLYLKSRTAELQAMGRGATFKELSKKNVAGFEINLPAIDRQLDAVAKLTAVRSQIALAKQQHDQLDSLVKSRFVEMFGELDTNPKGFQLTCFDDLGTWTSGGTPSRKNPSYFTGEIDWYSAGELNSLHLGRSKERISLRAIEESSAKLVPPGSLFVGMYDTAALKMGITTKESSSNQACANLVPNGIVDLVWLYFAIDQLKPSLLAKRSGCRQKNLSLKKIKSFMVPLPDLDSQQGFSRFVAQVDKSRFIAQQQIEKLQMLYDSLAQDYFGD